ncbi:MAG: putative peptidoglycan lipid II flippase [Pseudohongiellaceae bacterium]|jgi:putative peptidoglycan lipid II flippase
MVANMIMNLLFYMAGLAHVGLALATSLAAFLNAGLLLKGLRSDGVFTFQAGWLVFSMRLILANALMATYLVMVSSEWQAWLGWSTVERVGQLTVLVLGGIVTYIVVLIAAGMRWRDIYR